MDENPNQHVPVRANIIETLVTDMGVALHGSVERTQASQNEVLSAAFTVVLRMIASTISTYGDTPLKAFTCRRELTILCERLWAAAAGEPFTRDQRKKTKEVIN